MRPFTVILFFSTQMLIAQTWNQVADFTGSPRDDAASFSIGDFGYVFTGMDNGFATTQNGFKFHAYSNIWYPIAPLPASPRQYGCGFKINGKGYLVGGINGSIYFNDCWEYNPVLDTWSSMDSIPSFGRGACTCFTIGDKGYIGTGATTDNVLNNEWWEFNPTGTPQWTQKSNFPGGGRKGMSGFSVNNKGYIVGGIDSLLIMYNDVWEYDTTLNTWTQKNNFNGFPRFGARGISINNTGYIVAGWDSSGNYNNDLWRYDEVADNWIALDTIPSYNRKGGSVFTVNNMLYYTCGIFEDGFRTTETWAYGNTIGINETENLLLSVYPNPSTQYCWVDYKGEVAFDRLLIFNINGESINEWSQPKFPIQISNLTQGIYFITLYNGDKIFTRKLVIY